MKAIYIMRGNVYLRIRTFHLIREARAMFLPNTHNMLVFYVKSDMWVFIGKVQWLWHDLENKEITAYRPCCQCLWLAVGAVVIINYA